MAGFFSDIWKWSKIVEHGSGAAAPGSAAAAERGGGTPPPEFCAAAAAHGEPPLAPKCQLLLLRGGWTSKQGVNKGAPPHGRHLRDA